MADLNIQSLLERAIDTHTKLHLLLIFYENSRLEATPETLAERCCRDIWSVRQALQEMAEDGVITASRTVGGETVYSFHPAAEFVAPIKHLMRSYDNPVEREEILSSIHELSGYAAIRHAPAPGWFICVP